MSSNNQEVIEELLASAKKPLEGKNQSGELVQIVPLSELDSYPAHPFQVREDAEMASLVASVKENGVLSPAVARKKDDDRYELISGHRRKHACELAGIEQMPVLVRELTDEQSAIEMCDANLQRERVLPSEKAWAYKLKLDALKKQGKRTDLTSAPVARKSTGKETAELVGELNGDSKDTVRRFIRLTELIPPLLQMVDEGKVAFRPAVEISYLYKKSQRELLSAMEREVCTPSLAQALKMKQFASEGKLTSEVILSIIQEPKSNQREQHRIPRESIDRFFKKAESLEVINETIVKALELYRKRERSRDQAR